MSEILQEIIVPVITAFLTGGIGSIFYFKQNKKLKEFEVKSAELENENKKLENENKKIDNSASINSEWERIANKLTNEREELVNEIRMQLGVIKDLQDKIDNANTSKDKAWEMYSNCKIDCAKKDRLISELNWYRCEINGCPYRKPPRKYGDFDFPENGVVKTDEKNEN